jgi:hypothetical protein
MPSAFIAAASRHLGRFPCTRHQARGLHRAARERDRGGAGAPDFDRVTDLEAMRHGGLAAARPDVTDALQAFPVASGAPAPSGHFSDNGAVCFVGRSGRVRVSAAELASVGEVTGLRRPADRFRYRSIPGMTAETEGATT